MNHTANTTPAPLSAEQLDNLSTFDPDFDDGMMRCRDQFKDGDYYRVEDVRALFAQQATASRGEPSECQYPHETDKCLGCGFEARASHGAQVQSDELAGRTVSVDVSTGDDDAGNRIFAELTGETGSDGTTLLAIETSRNFANRASSAPGEQDERARRWESKLDAVWANLSAMVEKHTGVPCEGEPLDALEELLSARAAIGSASNAPAEYERAGWFIREGAAWVATGSDDPRATILYRHAATTSPAGAASSAKAEPEQLTTDESREYLIKFMERHFTDKTFHRYIRDDATRANTLAGDFAWQMARALRMIGAPAATPASDTLASGLREILASATANKHHYIAEMARDLIAQCAGTPASDTRAADGLPTELELVRGRLDRVTRELQARQARDKGDVWYWQGEGDNLASMGNGMIVVIRADQLRDLAAPTAAIAEADAKEKLDPNQVQTIADRIRNSAATQQAQNGDTHE